MTEAEKEKAILAGLSASSMKGSERSTEASLDELSALLMTAGGEEAGRLLQGRQTPDPATFLGYGKVMEMREMIEATGSTLAVFDNELTPSQTRNLSEALGVRVLDRSSLILDIFASRAQTREGRLQVDLAQYKYMLPRLTGLWTHLDRETASGGSSPIGTRGTGETQLEDDRRYIRRRIEKLEEELQQVRLTRATQRKLRQKNHVPLIALVGYTNAGKSTLLNKLTDSDIPANNRLFDTLDTTTRKLSLSPTREVLISDTVGFIRKLPHHLINAFKATLEELTYADLILHVIDVSNPEWRAQAEVAEKLMDQLCSEGTPRVTVYNKVDQADPALFPEGKEFLPVSAWTGEGLDRLMEVLRSHLDDGRKEMALLLPYERGDLLNLIHEKGEVQQVEYLNEGIAVTAVLREPEQAVLEPFLNGRG